MSTRQKLLIFFLVALFVGIHRPLYATSWTVDPSGSGDFTSIQAAINASSSGDRITVLPGTYSENILLNGKNVTLTSTNPQNPLATIISGNAGSAVVEFSNGDESILRGFGITSFYTTRGILCISSSSTIELCEIFQNSDNIGGGLYFGGTSTASVINTIVRNNTAPSTSGGGGGVAIRDDVDITFINALFYGNSTGDEGGALNSSGNAHSTWANCTVTGNNAAWGGGLSSESPLKLDVVDSIIVGNSVTMGGANLYAAGKYENVDFWFSDLGGGYTGWPGATQGNIDADPLFVAGPLGNYYLDPLSPCVDAGSDLASKFFFGGTTRVDGLDDSGIVDMGYHYDAQVVPKPATVVAVDIKPRSCPNPVNVKSKSVLPIAILGTDDYVVTTVDPTSIRLAGVEPIRSSYEDVAGPVLDANDCNCTTEGPDGFLDLTLKFKTQRIVEAIGDVNDGDELQLELIGVLFDETPIEGADCILIRGRHKPINPADINKDGVVNAADFAIFTQNWLQSSIVDE